LRIYNLKIFEGKKLKNNLLQRNYVKNNFAHQKSTVLHQLLGDFHLKKTITVGKNLTAVITNKQSWPNVPPATRYLPTFDSYTLG